MIDIARILDKLEPIIPEQCRRWRTSLSLLGDDTREILLKHIIMTASRLLGDYERALLLTLPPEKKATGEFALGKVIYEREKWEFGISKKELLQNLAIFGRSGAGKTNTAFLVLYQLSHAGIPFLFLDWKRTGRHLLPLMPGIKVYTPGRTLSPFPFNPFIAPPGLELRLYVNMLIDVLSDAFVLGAGSRSILQHTILDCVSRTDKPTASDILSAIESIPVKSRAQGWKVSAIRAIEALQPLEPADKGQSQQELIKSLLHTSTILELDGLNESEKKFLIPLLCLWLFNLKLAGRKREELDLVILVEEAHHVLYRQENRAKETVMNQLLRQCRELGIGMIIVDQHPHLVSSAALGNTYTSICLNLKEPSDINRAAALSLLDEQDKRWLSMLPTGYGVVKLQDRWPRPFLVRFPLMQFEKGKVTDEFLAGQTNRNPTLSEASEAIELKQSPFGESRSAVILDEGAIALIQDIISYPDEGVDARYKRLGWSVDRGNRIKRTLTANGLIDLAKVRVGRTQKVILRVSPAVRETFGFGREEVDRASVTHEFWKRFYGGRFTDAGYLVEHEARRGRGRVDVLARKGALRVAIEIETGKSDVLHNIRQDLLSGFDKVIVVATDEAALRKVERELAKAGLIIPSRLSVVLRDGQIGDEQVTRASETAQNKWESQESKS